MTAQSPYLTLTRRDLDVVRNLRRTVNVPVRLAGEPNSDGCLYEMAHGGLYLLTTEEVTRLNLQSITAGEGGGCLPANYHKLWVSLGLARVPAARRVSWWPCILCAGGVFGTLGAGWSFEWWAPHALHFLGVM